MGFGVKNPMKSVKKLASKAFSMPNKIASKVIGKIPVVGKPVSDFMEGKGPLGSLEKYLDPGSSLVKSFTNDPENFLKNWGGYKDDLGKVWTGVEGMKMMFNPPKPPKPEEAARPDAPDFASTWREYSSWTDTAKQQRDSAISTARAKLYEAGATPDVIAAQEAGIKSEYETKLAGYQQGANYKMLQQGFDIARGAAENPYAQSLVRANQGQDLAGYFSANYGADPVPKTDADLYRAKQAGGGSAGATPKAGPAPGGGGGEAKAEYAMAPGANPWLTEA